ncbi:hypothetical protein TNCV_4943061 [Trichonephila clavipes]|nr:hypothetical protein TNCV_4943061 [Trichonephila clavipes]
MVIVSSDKFGYKLDYTSSLLYLQGYPLGKELPLHFILKSILHSLSLEKIQVWKNAHGSSDDHLLGAAITHFFCWCHPDHSLERLPRRLRHSVFKRSSQFLSLDSFGLDCPRNLFRMCSRRSGKTEENHRHLPNQLFKTLVGSLSRHQYPLIASVAHFHPASFVLVPTSLVLEMDLDQHVAVPRVPYGGSINRHVTLTLRIPSWVCLCHNRNYFIQLIRGSHVRGDERLQIVQQECRLYKSLRLKPSECRRRKRCGHIKAVSNFVLTPVKPPGMRKEHTVSFYEYNVPPGHSVHPRPSNLTSIVLKGSSNAGALNLFFIWATHKC